MSFRSPSLQEIVVLLGLPVAGNPTQYMIEKAFAHQGLDWRYLSLEVAPEDLGDAVRGMRAMGFRGANITAPHKVAVIEFLDELSESAALMGSVNCIVRPFLEGPEQRLRGENSDGQGFLEALRGVADPAGKRCVLLGAGGAARAIAIELALAGVAEITVVNRTPERGQALVDLVNAKTQARAQYVPWEGVYEPPAETRILIQATTLGLGDGEARVPVSLATLEPGAVVADLIANPPETQLIRDARELGHPTLDGLGMMINQGAIAFRLWTGIEPDKTIMRDAVEEFLGL